jgi:hypothetical protein
MCDFNSLYESFDHPITDLDCGRKCAPYNEHRRPFCCDVKQTVPTVYLAEWEYLKENTDLWHLWFCDDPDDEKSLRSEVPEGQVLVECLGHHKCQRTFRSITCRSFPFFPYITREGNFLGLSYYHQFEDRCWLISNLDRVSSAFREEFIIAYQRIFECYPSERENFRYHSIIHRQVFGKRKIGIPLLHMNGLDYLVNPKTGQLESVAVDSLPKHGPYEIAAMMPFPDELKGEK